MGPQLTALDGHIRTCGRDENNKNFSWRYNKMIIRDKTLPATILQSLPGRPITAVFEHPILSSDLIITRAWVEHDDGEYNLMIEFEQPRFLFNRDTCRVWPEESLQAS